MASRRGAAGPQEVNPEYEAIVKDILAGVDEGSREVVGRVLASDKAVQMYDILRGEGMAPKYIKNVIIESVHDLHEGKSISVGAYLKNIGMELEENEKGRRAVYGLYQNGVISERQYDEIERSAKGHERFRIKSTTNSLEGLARAAAYLFIISGIAGVLVSGVSFTGNVVGGSRVYPTSLFVIGLAVFIAGLILGRKN